MGKRPAHVQAGTFLANNDWTNAHLGRGINNWIEWIYNLTAPHPLSNAEMMSEFRKAYGMPFGLPATNWMLEIGAFFLRTETELIIKSRRVVSGRLLEEGFEFEYPRIGEAIEELQTLNSRS